MSLSLAFELDRGPLHLAVALDVPSDQTLALVGPNGAGKSTMLHAIAGLLRIDSGSIAMAGTTWDGGPTGPFVPPESRRIGFLFQDHLLFPHLDVLDNVAFSLRARGRPRAAARTEAMQWLSRVSLADRAAAWPKELSGGQAQRVALARALASRPQALLLDEPLAAVDASLRHELRRELKQHLATFTGPRIVVSHDAIDAFVLADRIAVIERGRIIQVGTPTEICSAPRSRYVADLVGVNLVRGTCRDGIITTENGGTLRVAHRGEGAVLATVHPRAISLFQERPSGSPRNVWQAAVTAVEPSVDCLRVRFDGPFPLVAEITDSARRELGIEVGARLWLALKATEISVSEA